MKKKQILSIVMASALVMGMTACSSSTTSKSNVSSDTTKSAESGSNSVANSDKTFKIGISQMVEHPALDAATKGFEEACKKGLGEDKVSFDVQNAQGEQAMCSTIATNFVSSNVDLILANATLPLQTASSATADIPIIGTAVTDYATALEIKDWSGATGINVSGTSDLAPIDKQEEMLKELIPNAKKVGIVYCSAEPNSKYQADLFGEALDKDNIAHAEYTAADSNEIQSVVTSAIGECDVLYIPTDNTMASNTEIIKNICVPAKIPVIAGEQGLASGCGIATLSIDYYELGYKAGEMACDVLLNGTDISTMKIEYSPEVKKMYNKEICDELGITIPEGYEEIKAEE
ncbi:ABC transporter substrate-binding protein [Lachnospiraceae bacterium TWA4]|nr:ABC transporter substrate-binding protein [Lachnospiraceae bacterium TWA4]